MYGLCTVILATNVHRNPAACGSIVVHRGVLCLRLIALKSLEMIGIWNNRLLKLIIQYLSLSFLRTVSAARI